MNTAASPVQRIAGVDIELTRRGQGRPILFLHPHIGLHGADEFVDALSRSGEVIVPSHPGFGASSLPPHFTTVDDLAYFYLDLLDELALKEVLLVGASFGAWIALEAAVKSTARISTLALLGAVGAKFGPRERSDIVDVFSTPRAKLEELMWHDAGFRRDTSAMAEADLEALARNWETLARFAWSPYMHDPKLRTRLHRVRIPTLLLWGADDRIAPAAHGRAYAGAIAGAQFAEVPEAGHFPHIEKPAEAARRVIEFAVKGTR